MENNKAILLGKKDLSLIREETLASIFKQTAKRFPKNIALHFNSQSISYEDLDRWSDAFAELLTKKNITEGDKVGIWFPRSIELHVAILGITKAGVTYVPLDEEMPKERVETVLEDVQATYCITKKELTPNYISLDVIPFSKEFVQNDNNTFSNNIFAYILYTSGSTGKPKGIPIMHKQICHLIRAENDVLQINENDKVYQGFSVSFDMWCEETWISYLVGASLYIADATTAKAIDELSDVLIKNNITILHAVPSLLAIMDENIPSVRIINAGGEACTETVVNKWASQNRKLFNSYGPTETTVTSSMIELHKGQHITIGTPLANYNYAIVDEKLSILPFGELGELIITGNGVGNGYINLPELTASKFIQNPFDENELPGKIIYKTGDEAIIFENGEVEFHGRMDDQVKLRGYRIELGEIENQISIQNGITSCAVVVMKDSFQQEQLIAFITTNHHEVFNEDNTKKYLQQVLAPYMVPQFFVHLDEMPRLPSGKINRKQLPKPSFFEKNEQQHFQFDGINQTIHDKVISVLHHYFPEKEINNETDFFTDLSGHSLLAASIVSTLRKDDCLKNISLKDIYLNRPIQKLIQEWEKNTEPITETKNTYQPISKINYWLCFVAQSISLIFIYGLFACQIFLPYLGYYYIQTETESHLYGILFSLGLFCILPPALSSLSIIIKWLVIGKYKEGEYPLWGLYYFKWWFVERIESLVQVNFLNGTPLYRTYLRIRGLKIGADAQIGTLNISAEDLIEIGENVTISSNVIFNNVVVEDGLIKFSKIKIDDNVYIGSRCVIDGNTLIHSYGEMQELSCLKNGTTILAHEIWGGSPAEKKAIKKMEDIQFPVAISSSRKLINYIKYSFTLLIFPFTLLFPLIPVLIIITNLDNDSPAYDFSYFVYIPLLSLLYMTLFALQTIVISRILQYKLKEGSYSIYSKTYFTKWLSDQMMSLSLMIMHPVFATVYISSFFRALGSKIGQYTEISTANNVTHPLLEIGENSFIADNVNLGECDIRNQQLILEKTIIGNKSFVGNSALIPQGYQLGNDMLIGVLSVPPTKNQIEKNPAKDWFGSPAIALPNRQESQDFNQNLTFRPSNLRWLSRALIELIRIIIPETILLCSSILFIAYVHDILIGYAWWQFIILFPIYFLGFVGLPCFLFVVVLKWVFVGKYKSEQIPMWSLKVWISEAITSSYEALSVPFFLDFLRGTAWLPFFLRFLGVKIQNRVFMDTTDVTEFDMVSIGKEAALNADCGPQTHLFEDRVMKVGKISIGKKSSIGAGSIILFDSEIGENVKIGSLSLMMKGENLEKNSNWEGSPLRKS